VKNIKHVEAIEEEECRRHLLEKNNNKLNILLEKQLN
jgi:hypothetical protein